MIQPDSPKPFHPQQRFGSGGLPAALAFPHLAAYYGEQFLATFTTMDLLDSLAARVKEMEEKFQGAEESAQIAEELGNSFTEAIKAITIHEQPVKPSWRARLLFRILGWGVKP